MTNELEKFSLAERSEAFRYFSYAIGHLRMTEGEPHLCRHYHDEALHAEILPLHMKEAIESLIPFERPIIVATESRTVAEWLYQSGDGWFCIAIELDIDPRNEGPDAVANTELQYVIWEPNFAPINISKEQAHTLVPPMIRDALNVYNPITESFNTELKIQIGNHAASQNQSRENSH